MFFVVSSTAHLDYHILAIFVNNFFQVFLFYFKNSCAFFERLNRITPSFLFVNTLFLIFSLIFQHLFFIFIFFLNVVFFSFFSTRYAHPFLIIISNKKIDCLKYVGTLISCIISGITPAYTNSFEYSWFLHLIRQIASASGTNMLNSIYFNDFSGTVDSKNPWLQYLCIKIKDFPTEKAGFEPARQTLYPLIL